jgi:hypothetical protein
MMRNILVSFYRNQRKRRANMFGLVVLLVVSALGVLSVHAFEGEMVGVELNQVTCTNTTTGATMPGNILPGGVYDCETVPAQSGHLVTVTLSGIASTGNTNCIDVVDNEASAPLITLTEGACFNLRGTIATGTDNPVSSNWDIDIFLFQLPGIIGLRLSLVGDEGIQFGASVGDAEETSLICFLTPESCRGDIISSGLGSVGILANAPGAYTLKLQVVAEAGAPRPVRQQEVMSNHDVTTAVAETMKRFIELRRWNIKRWNSPTVSERL